MTADQLPPNEPSGMTWTNYVQSVARSHGLSIDEDEVEFVLWELTPWPVSGFDETTRRLRRVFAEKESTRD